MSSKPNTSTIPWMILKPRKQVHENNLAYIPNLITPTYEGFWPLQIKEKKEKPKGYPENVL